MPHAMKRRYFWVFVVPAIMLLLLLWGLRSCGLIGGNEWHQKLTVTVETPEGERSGSAVIAEYATSGYLLGAGEVVSYDLKGEATAVEVAPGKYLIALLDEQAKFLAAISWWRDGRTPDDVWDIIERKAKTRETAEVARKWYPPLYTYTDVNDPASAKKVNPDNLAASFGPGYKLKSITITITDEPVTEGRLESIFPWLRPPEAFKTAKIKRLPPKPVKRSRVCLVMIFGPNILTGKNKMATLKEELLYAILAMDSYNRDYEVALKVEGNQIGSATYKTFKESMSQSQLSESEKDTLSKQWVAKGFYAAEYKLADGTTVISYRGTDTLWRDPVNGWVVALGDGGSGTQAPNALNFYETVTKKKYQDGSIDKVILTGHSLGGGLAEYVSALSGTTSFIYDHMPGLDAAIFKLSTDYHDIEGFDPSVYLHYNAINAEHVAREILTVLRAASGEEHHVSNNAIESHTDTIIPSASLHGMDYLVLLKFAASGLDGKIHKDWYSIGFLLAKSSDGEGFESGRMGRVYSFENKDESIAANLNPRRPMKSVTAAKTLSRVSYRLAA